MPPPVIFSGEEGSPSCAVDPGSNPAWLRFRGGSAAYSSSRRMRIPCKSFRMRARPLEIPPCVLSSSEASPRAVSGTCGGISEEVSLPTVISESCATRRYSRNWSSSALSQPVGMGASRRRNARVWKVNQPSAYWGRTLAFEPGYVLQTVHTWPASSGNSRAGIRRTSQVCERWWSTRNLRNPRGCRKGDSGWASAGRLTGFQSEREGAVVANTGFSEVHLLKETCSLRQRPSRPYQVRRLGLGAFQS